MRKYAKKLKIPQFLGAFLRDGLPKYIYKQGNGIVNLDTTKRGGTHWVADTKKNGTIIYFDSYGNLQPPKLIYYFLSDDRTKQIGYDHDSFQSYDTYICGHLCLNFSYTQYK